MTERNRKPLGETPPNGAPEEERPLSDLKTRLAQARARGRKTDEGDDGRNDSGVGIAVRVGVELAGTLAVGVGIGWALDRWLGTGPWFLVVFFFLGAAAGVLNVYRAVKNIGLAAGYRPAAEDEDKETGG